MWNRKNSFYSKKSFVVCFEQSSRCFATTLEFQMLTDGNSAPSGSKCA